MKKNSVLIVGAVGTLLFGFLVFLGTDTCYVNTTCKILRGAILNGSSVVTFFFPGILFFSLITYKMREEVFQAWWRFARWWVLVIVAVTLFLQNAGGGGGIGISGAVGGAFDALILGILYVILVITSLVKIVRAYLKTKN